MANYSIPEPFERRMQEQLGIQYLSFKDSLTQNAPSSIRLNPFKSAEVAKDDQVPWSSFGYYLNERPIFTLDPVFHAGAYYVQEASSMFLEQAIRQSVDLTQSHVALDLCAAPGGKSTHMLSLLSNDSFLVSNEAIRSRASILSENMQKWGNANCVVTNNDPEDFQSLTGLFDIIVVDAPCSGEGLFRKDPEAMHEWSEENVTLCSQRQRRILHDVWPSLKTNGILIYCTCTYNEAENEENLQWLNSKNGVEFLSLSIDKTWGIETVEKDGIVGYRFYPHRLKGEGFFLSVIRKTEEQDHVKIQVRSPLPLLSGKRKDIFNNWITEPERFELVALGDLIVMLPKNRIDEINFLSQKLNVVTKGTAIATLKHEKAIPEHAFALSHFVNTSAFSVFDVKLDEALKYLRKETFDLPSSEKGFGLIRFNHLPLGWINHLGNRFNNLYPVNWRIKMNG